MRKGEEKKVQRGEPGMDGGALRKKIRDNLAKSLADQHELSMHAVAGGEGKVWYLGLRWRYFGSSIVYWYSGGIVGVVWMYPTRGLDGQPKWALTNAMWPEVSRLNFLALPSSLT